MQTVASRFSHDTAAKIRSATDILSSFPEMSETPLILEINSGFICARQPVTAIKAAGFLFTARRMIRSAFLSLSAVTVHVFII
jgi:hypothetical protein